MMENKGVLIQLSFVNIITILLIAGFGFYGIGAITSLIKTMKAGT